MLQATRYPADIVWIPRSFWLLIRPARYAYYCIANVELFTRPHPNANLGRQKLS